MIIIKEIKKIRIKIIKIEHRVSKNILTPKNPNKTTTANKK